MKILGFFTCNISCTSCCCCCKKKRKFAKHKKAYKRNLKKIKLAGLETYDIFLNEKYAALVEAIVKYTNERNTNSNLK